MNDQKSDAGTHEDEYRFEDFDKFDMPDDEGSAAGAHAASTASKPMSSADFAPKKDHRKMIIIGVVLVIILGFGINSLVSRLGSVSIPKEGSTLPKAAAGVQPQPTVAPVAPVQAAPPVATASEVDRLNDLILAQQQTMSQMQASINSLQEAMAMFNGNLGDLSQKMTDTLNKLPAKPIARPKPAVVMPSAPPRPVYTIRALVPGRAWLQSNDGQSITVINGDEVAGYGTVQDIDLNAGQVVLSDGTIFGYNLNS